MWLYTMLLIYASTFVVMNGKMKSESKAGFFTFVAVISLLALLFSWLFG